MKDVIHRGAVGDNGLVVALENDPLALFLHDGQLLRQKASSFGRCQVLTLAQSELLAARIVFGCRQSDPRKSEVILSKICAVRQPIGVAAPAAG